MKLSKLFSPVILLAVVMAAAMSSCSNDETIEGKLKKYVSDDTDIIVALDLKRSLDAADITIAESGEIELPDYISDFTKDAFSTSERKALNQLLDFKGVDWTNTVMGFKLDKKSEDNPFKSGLIIFSIKDTKEFATSLEDLEDSDLELEEEKEEGFEVISNKHFAILVDGNLGFIAIKKDGPCKASSAAELINEWKDQASDNTIADWKLEKFKEEKVARALINFNNIVGIFDNVAGRSERESFKALGLDKLDKATALLTFDLEGETASFDVAMFNKEGGEFEMPGVKVQKLDNSLMAYATEQDIMAGAIGIADASAIVKSWAEAALINSSDLAQAKQLAAALNNSTIFFAAGPTNGISSFNNPDLGNWHGVLAIHFANTGNARTLINLLASSLGDELANDGNGNMSLNIPTGYTYNPYTYDRVPTSFKTIYIKQDGTDVIISNGVISKSGTCKLDKKIFEGKSAAFVFAMSKNNSLLSQLNMPFGFEIQGVSTKSTGTASVKLTGVEGKFIPTLFKFIYKNMGSVMGSSDYADYSDYEYADSVACEETVAVEEVAADSVAYAY